MKKTAGTLVLQSLLPLGDIIFIASAAFDQGWYQVGLAGRDGRDMWHSGILGLMTLLPIENENSFVFYKSKVDQQHRFFLRIFFPNSF